MTLPALPAKRTPDYYAYMQALDSAVRASTGTDPEVVRDTMAAALIAGSGVSITPDAATDTITVTNTAAAGHLNVKDYGAVGDGTTDDSAAFAAAVLAAKNALRAAPASLTYTDKLGTVVIDIPPGDYRITDPGAFLGDETMTEKGLGLRWRGAGKTISNIIFQPATAGILASNDYWQALEFIDLGFRATTAGCTFLKTATTHSAQRYLFRSCTFEKFKYGVALEGDDNNSEYLFFDCHTLSHQNDGAFFYVGATNTVDQFLNYWFYGCTHWNTSAPFIDAARGGHFHIYGLDASAFGQALTGPGYLFALRGTAHSLGVCNFEVNGLRVEARNANARLLLTEWPYGNIALRSVDWSSQTATYTYGDIIYIDLSGFTGGPIVTVADSELAGGVRVKMSTVSWQHAHRIRFTSCNWLQRNSPSDVVSYDTSATSGNTLPLPPVEFIGCRGPNNDITSATGFAVWDARIGYRGQLLQTLEERVLSVRGTYGTPASGTYTFTLPQGALITGLRALSPAGGGGVTEGDGGSWTLATTEGTPTTVASVTVSTALSAGYDVTTSLSTPFHCSTAARAKLTITPTNVAQWNYDALLLVKGYW